MLVIGLFLEIAIITILAIYNNEKFSTYSETEYNIFLSLNL